MVFQNLTLFILAYNRLIGDEAVGGKEIVLQRLYQVFGHDAVDAAIASDEHVL